MTEGIDDPYTLLRRMALEGGIADQILTELGSIGGGGDPATQTTLAAVLAKLSGDPSTETTLASVLAKLSGDPATETTLAAILNLTPNDPATGNLQNNGNASLNSIANSLTTTLSVGIVGVRPPDLNVFNVLGASDSVVVPGCLSWSFLVITGTATITSSLGATSSPIPATVGDRGDSSSGFTITTGLASSVYYRWDAMA